ncbi:hypothetical protein F4782DRAFT_505707 [Xylaria castorea]|nr:hypothetical protein F4782DRAFT_505707 [Xylaria castorea]
MLYIYSISYVVDTRRVPEPKQDILWRHMRVIREQRAGEFGMSIEKGKKKSPYRNHAEPKFKWVKGGWTGGLGAFRQGKAEGG